jgi:hypothetical protein
MTHASIIPYISGLSAGILAYFFLRVRSTRLRGQLLPPGPKSYPLIGNLVR